MPLFQQSVLKKYISDLDKTALEKAWKLFSGHFQDTVKQANIRNLKEEEYQEGFVRDLFVSVFGYTLNPQPAYNFVLEKKSTTDATKSDGAILSGGEVIAVIELKDTGTPDLDKVSTQAFGYKHKHRQCTYVITSNFEKLRFYINDATDYEEFNLFTLSQERFAVLYLCLQQQQLQNGIPLQLKQNSLIQEENVTKKLYADYSLFKRQLFQSILQLNPSYDKLLLFKKTQKLLDRFLFILFAEDRLLLPPNSIREILSQWEQLKDLDNYVPLYERFKKYFGYLNTGHVGKKHEIFAYNGGLFLPDEVLDAITIDDAVLFNGTKTLSNYDYETDVDVNILGHIFEHSLSEIEELQAELEGKTIEKNKTKRKKDGVFYTPRYITKYIVENTVGALCTGKKKELHLNEESFEPKKRKDKRKALLDIIDTYRNWLLELTICDPACGSGAFLNAALEYLINEHRTLDELTARIFNTPIVYPDIQNSILENNLFGVDINEDAIEIAKLSLWLHTAKKGRKLSNLSNNIKCGNSLIDDATVAGDKAFNWKEEFKTVFDKGGFDVVIGNPPYVVYIKSKVGLSTLTYINNKYKYAQYNPNTYALFSELGLNILLNKNGYLGFIIPNTWIDNTYFSKMRENIYLKRIIEIIDLKNSAFDEIVETIIILAQNSNASNYSVKLKRNLLEELSCFENYNIENLKKGLNPFQTNENPLLKKLQSDFNKIKDYAIVYRGIETKDNAKWLSVNKLNNDYRPILLGKDVNKYFTQHSGTYIKFIKKEMKSNANEEFYKRNKILMRRTGSSIIADIDITSAFALKNLYLIIPNGEYLYLMLAQLNSKLLAFFHKEMTSGENKAFAQFKGVYVESFPFVYNEEMEGGFKKKILSLKTFTVDEINNQKALTNLLQTKFPTLNINNKLQSWASLSSGEFLKELQKQKIKLSLSEQQEWLQYFEEQKTKANNIQQIIQQTDKEIDEMVYELYGLTEEEKKIVENAG